VGLIGHGKIERGPVIGAALGLDVAAVAVDDPLDGGEAVLAAPQFLHDAFALCRRQVGRSGLGLGLHRSGGHGLEIGFLETLETVEFRTVREAC
jgi:hypothetical protein